MKKTNVVSMAAALLPAVALAAEGGGEGASNPFAGDVGTALWTLVIFGLVILVLGKFAWGPVLKGLQAREHFIRDSLRQAKEDREAAQARLEEYDAKLATARAEARAIVEEARRDGDVLKRKLDEEARAESERTIARALREIGLAKDAAVQELYQASAALAAQLAERVIRRELAPGDHERLIAEAIEELERLEKK
jgi:F-type H+-transporting ATPase subunit b